MKEALELARKLESLRKALVEGSRIHGGLGFVGSNLELLQQVERFLILNSTDDDRYQRAYELASEFELLKCATGGSTRQEVAVHELSLLVPVLEKLSEEKSSAGSGAGLLPAPASESDTPGEAQRDAVQPPRFSSQITSTAAAHKVNEYLEEQKRRSGLTMKTFAELSGTTYQAIAKFRKTGSLRRSILVGVAEAMGLTLEQLLATDGEQHE